MFLKEAIGKNLTFKNAKKNYVLVPYLLIFIEFFSYFKRKRTGDVGRVNVCVGNSSNYTQYTFLAC